jgi:signal transduction histidine kinase/CheY-like chemotaxis protein
MQQSIEAMEPSSVLAATRILYDVAHVLDSTEETERRVRSVGEWLRRVVPYDRCALLVVLPGQDSRFLEWPQSSETEQRKLRQVLTDLFVALDDRVTPDTHPFQENTGLGYSSYLAVPLVGFDDHFGLLFVASTLSHLYTEEHLKLLSVVASQLAAFFSKLHLVEVLRARSLELEAVNRAKDDFLATLSHELRTPLNAIVGWTSLLQTGPLDDATIASGLEVIHRNAKLQARLIDDILDMSRVITGKLRLDFGPVDLSVVVGFAVESARLTAEAKEIRITMNSNEAIGAVVEGDSNRLQQVVWNLLANAIKFTPRGGRIEILLERQDSHVRLHVIDTGVGISVEFLPHVFDRFRQADSSSSRKFSGLGLGLALVRHLVQLHGGRVWADSAGEGQGATFTVDLPLISKRRLKSEVAKASANPEAQEEEHRTALDGLPDLKGCRVLLVDDDADSLEMIAETLRQCQAHVLTATSASEAYELVQHHRFEAMVADIGMPDEDGFTLLRKIRDLTPERGGRIPAVALTGYTNQEDQATRAGFQFHLSKPVDPAQLLTVLANLLAST